MRAGRNLRVSANFVLSSTGPKLENGLSPHFFLLLPFLTKAKSNVVSPRYGAYTIDHHFTSSALSTFSPSMTIYTLRLQDFPIGGTSPPSSPSFVYILPKQWRRNIDYYFPFTQMRNRLVAYAISVSGVQLSEFTDVRSCDPGTQLNTTCRFARPLATTVTSSGTDMSSCFANGG